MVLKRLIPCLQLQDRRLVKAVNFSSPAYIGDPINAIKIFNDKEVDELVLLDILSSKKGLPIDYDLLEDCAAECFMPLSYGGGVRYLEDFRRLFQLGIEKVIVNSLLFDDQETIKNAVKIFGSQSIVASIDVMKIGKSYEIFSHAGKKTELDLINFVQAAIDIGCGEILITSVNLEGSWNGYDIELAKTIDSKFNVPVVINGGCGSVKDLVEVFSETNISAAAIGSMSVYQKQNKGVLIRFPKRNQVIKDE